MAMRGRLNLFQATMLRWRELHPYSAVHMVRVLRPCDPVRLKAHIEARLERAGLTGLVLDAQRRRFDFEGGRTPIELTVLPAGPDPRETARREIVRQLNLPFPRDGRFSPFRFFVVAGADGFDVGLAYDHFLAGGDSIAVLLRDCLEGYGEDVGTAAPAWTPRLYPRTYGRLFLSRIGSVLRGFAYLPALAASCKRSYRAPCCGDRDAENDFIAHRIDPAVFDGARRAAKAWSVTIGDLFLATLLLALDPIAAGRGAEARRRELGVASIVNLRGELESDARACFGQFLASLRVSHPVPPGIGLEAMAAAVHAETSRYRARRLYLQSLLALGVSGLIWRSLSPSQRRCFLAKHYPIWAGISAVHVDLLWRDAADAAAPREYVRAVSTGPLAPFVFAMTTLGDVAWLGVSFRPADVSRETAEHVAGEFLRHLASLA
jgi:hypothetical protein